MKLLVRISVLSALGLALLTGSVASAGSTSPEAARHFDQGVKLYEEGDWRGALVEFERAYATLPNYRVLYDIGQSRFQLQDYAGALEALQKYLAEGSAEVIADRRERVAATIADLQMRVAHLRITSNVSGAEVAIDDVTVGTTPLPDPVVVSVGRRRISLSTAGRPPLIRFVDVAGQDSLDLALNLESPPAPAAARSIASLVVIPATPTARRSTVPAWIAFGVGAAGAVVGTYFGIAAIDDKRNLDRQCVNKACRPESQALIDESNHNAVLSTIGVATAIAGVGAGIGLLVFAQGGERAPSAAQALRLYVGPTSALAAGSF
jgi:hypothetical protein